MLQLNPQATPAEIRNWLINQAQTGTLFTTGNDNDYANFRSLMGGFDRFLYNPFNSPNQITVVQS
jgi:hypothetical protein